jgi:protein-L-isoaspartate(D-aspartate) O-methyltransferase
MSFELERERLVENELRILGIRDEAVLRAMRIVPREAFVAEEMREFAYRNAPLPIGSGQTISQPLIVAHMTEALELAPHERVLEIGTGSGYAAAVLSRIAKEVFTIERHRELAETAGERLKQLGYENVQVRLGDGTRGWPEEARFDAIVVTAAGPGIPQALLEQLRIGGRLVMPVGEEQDSQQLIRAIRRGDDKFEYDELGAVRFVPLIGEAGWQSEEESSRRYARKRTVKAGPKLPELIREAAEPFSSIENADLQPLLDRIGDARVVLIGEASHGTSEFHRIRAEITKALLDRKNFDFVAVEADWPDAYRIHDFVTHKEREEPRDWEAFSRFPTWMWRNQEVLDFIHWLRGFNLEGRPRGRRVSFYGLDLYSLMELKHVRSALPDSYERLMHLTEMDAFFLPLAKSRNQQLTSALAQRRLDRAIGVIYRPETERLSHYFVPHSPTSLTNGSGLTRARPSTCSRLNSVPHTNPRIPLPLLMSEDLRRGCLRKLPPAGHDECIFEFTGLMRLIRPVKRHDNGTRSDPDGGIRGRHRCLRKGEASALSLDRRVRGDACHDRFTRALSSGLVGRCRAGLISRELSCDPIPPPLLKTFTPS